MEIIHYVVNTSLHSKARLSADLCLREKTLSNSLPAGTRRSIVWALMINFLRGFWICAFRYTYICVTLSRERPEPIHYSFCWLVQRFRVKGPFSPGGWYGTEGGGEGSGWRKSPGDLLSSVSFTFTVTGWWHGQCVDLTWWPNGAQLSEFTRNK